MADALPLRGAEPQDVPEAEVAKSDQRHWSVTTLLDVLDKPAIPRWAAKETAIAAIKHQDTWQSIEQSSGTEEAVRWLANARFRPAKGEMKAADLGTAVHKACEDYALTGQRPQVVPEVQPFLDQFNRWLNTWQPIYRATEVTVYSPTYGYAGTCDGFLDIRDKDDQLLRLIIDYKTTRRAYDARGNPTGPYPEAALQLAGYRHAELAAVWRPRRFESFRRRYYLLGKAEQRHALPVPEVDGGGIIHITPEHCEIYPVRCDQAVYDAFLYVLKVARWQYQLANTAIGLPMVRPEREPT